MRLAYQLLKTSCLLWLLAMSGQSLAVDTDKDVLSDDWGVAHGQVDNEMNQSLSPRVNSSDTTKIGIDITYLNTVNKNNNGGQHPGHAKISKADDFSKLKNDQPFSLRVKSKSEDKRVMLLLSKLTENGHYTQMEAISDDGSLAIITLTDSLTRVFIKTKDGMYEYAGEDFNGTAQLVTKLNINDDIYLPQRKVHRVESTVKLIKYEELPES